MGWNHTGMIMATKKKQPRKRGGNKTRAPETAPPSGLGGGWEKMASGYPAREPADAGRPNLQQIPLPKNYFPLVETFIGALGAAFATRAFRHLTEPRRLVVFVGHIGMHSGAPVLHVTDELERTEDGRVLARPLCSPEHVSPAMKAWPVTRLKTTHDALTAGAHWCHRCEELAKVQVEEFAKRRAESEVLIPAGPKIAVTGGLDFNDHRLIWAKLDQVHAKHPDMVLLHGGSPKGAERIAARWADHHKVPQIAFKPDWTKHAKAAPFKRNDQMLAVLPIGVMVFPGTGIQDNLADKARKFGIPVWKFGSGGA